MKTTELMYKVEQRYIKLRAAIIEAYNHPDDDYYDMLETYAYDMLEEAISMCLREQKRNAYQKKETNFPSRAGHRRRNIRPPAATDRALRGAPGKGSPRTRLLPVLSPEMSTLNF